MKVNALLFILPLLSIFPILAQGSQYFDDLRQEAQDRANLLKWQPSDAEIQKF